MSCQLVTGGAGFIGSCYVLRARRAGVRVVTLDKLTYSGNRENLSALEGDAEHIFIHGDIADKELVTRILTKWQPDAVVNFAAESHVDRSVLDPDIFVRTNVLGTCSLLAAATDWWKSLSPVRREAFRFLHVSTDEVFGSLLPGAPSFTEASPYNPQSAYAASKASSDHFVRAFFNTYGLPVLITNCSNNYGPRQFPEKLIPLVILRALAGESLPVYGDGQNIRDWLHVEDHCSAVARVLEAGTAGQTYLVGGQNERANLEIVRGVCAVLDDFVPRARGRYEDLIRFVADRPGHDFRYSVDSSRLQRELGWRPAHSFDDGLMETVRWYLENPGWMEHVQNGPYRAWMETNYAYRGVRSSAVGL